MDLIERQRQTMARHPWELARASAVLALLKDDAPRGARMLDYGCGDAYTGVRVAEALGAELVGCDPHLTPELIQQLHKETGGRFENDPTSVGSGFTLLLLLDVIEHVADDVGFVNDVAKRHLVSGARVLVTVPAFQGLFTAHDVALKHHRRYTQNTLRSALTAAGLHVEGSGYLFSSLLLPRSVSRLREMLLGPAAVEGQHGVGGWQRGVLLSRSIQKALELDNQLMLFAHKLGIAAPGLSVWARCRWS